MDLRAVAKKSACDEVFDQLTANIVGGGLAAGEALLSERRLAEVLGVSRPIVREALQRLASAGLVEVRQGGSTTVRDFKRHGGLNLLAQLLSAGGRVDLSVARSIADARQRIGPEIAALAAERSGPTLGPALDDLVAALDDIADPVDRQRRALAFWDVLVDGTGSIVFRLMFNSLRVAYEPVLDALATVLTEDPGRHRALARAVISGDPGRARRRAAELLTPSTAALLDAIDQLEAHR
ncbi:FadR/GntR family transcriptional regulator [Virgisporangium aurantiacum]|uniref:FadR/GntR family transcriptional regulator n=1 Tax=Virgisporangium aurantiacum TaxID=175570 RepID=UPI00194F79A1|nr:GntR family transcriptional regulator [Virgisporangium aurantiacum]